MKSTQHGTEYSAWNMEAQNRESPGAVGRTLQSIAQERGKYPLSLAGPNFFLV